MLALPRVLLASVVAALVLALSLSTAPSADAAVTYSDPAQEIIDLTNKERSANGLSSLKRSRALDAVAQAWAEELAAIYERALIDDPYAGVPLSHNPSTGKQIPSNWYAWGENVAWNRGYSDPIVKMNDQWIKSEHHHENMVNTRFNYMGAGWYTDKFGVSWGVQVFGQYLDTDPDAGYSGTAGSSSDTVSLARGNTYYIKTKLGRGAPDLVFSVGKSTDTVLVGDWDGDGVDTLGLKRGNVYYLWNNFGDGDPWKTFTTGRSSDVALVGDFNGDGKDTISLQRGNKYYIKYKLGRGKPSTTFTTGKSSDVAVVGDFNGNGKDTVSLKRGSTYIIKYKLGRGKPTKTFSTGKSSDVAIVGDFDGDGRDTVSLKRGDTYYIKNKLSPGAPDKKFVTGDASDIAMVGDYNG